MDGLSAVGDPELRDALLFACSRPAPVSADDLAAGRGMHRNVARARLDRLADAGLLIPAFERRSGRSGPGAGRPAKVFRVAPSVSSIEFPERRYQVLVGLLLDALPDRGRHARLHEIGAAFGADFARAGGLRRAKTVRAGVRGVCSALGRLGYQATVEEASPRDAVVVTPACPLRPVVRERSEAAEVDRGFWEGLTAAALGAHAATVKCQTRDCHAADSRCRVRITVANDG